MIHEMYIATKQECNRVFVVMFVRQEKSWKHCDLTWRECITSVR